LTPAALSVRSLTGPVGVLALLSGGAALGWLGSQRPMLAIAMLILAGAVAAIIFWPEIATLLVAFLIWMNATGVAVTYHGLPETLGAGVPLLLLVPLVANYLRGERIQVGAPFAFVVLLLAVQIVSTLLSRHQDVALEKLLTFSVEGLLVYLLVTNAVRTPETLRRCVWALLAAGACLSAVTVYQKLTGGWSRPFGGFGSVGAAYFVFDDATPRAAGPLGDPNYYAQILLTLAPLGFIQAWSERRPELRFAAGGATLLILAGVMLTNSRGAALAFGVVLVVMGFMHYIKRSQLVALLAGVLILLTLVPEYRDRVSTITSATAGATSKAGAEEGEESTRARTGEMAAGTLVFFDHPIVGVGPAVFPYYYQEYADRIGLQVHETTRFGEKKGQQALRQVHNLFLGVAADLGLAGLIAFCGLLFVTSRALVRARRRWRATAPEAADLAAAFLLAIVAYISIGLFLTLAFERYFWLLMALAAAAASLRVGDADRASPRSRAG
jgi:O-antigen ligase